MNLTAFLKTIDLFGRTVNLRFMGRDKFKTRCGGVSTLIMLLTLIVIFGLGIYDVYRGELASFNTMTLNSYDIEDILTVEGATRATSQQRILAFGVDSAVIDESILTITPFHEIGKNAMNMGNKIYDCSEEVYRNLIPGLHSVVPANLRIKCLNVSAYDLDRGIKPSVLFSRCQSQSPEKDSAETPDVACKPLSAIRKHLKRLDIWAFTLTDATNFASRDSREVSRFTASRIPVSFKYQKMARLTLRKMKVESTEGAFFQKKHTTSTVVFLSSEQEITSSYGEQDILHLSLKMDRNSQVLIKKRYKSVFNLFAYIGGLSKGIAMFLMMLVFPVREVLYYQNLINNMFNVCLDEKQKEIALKTMFPKDETSQSNNNDEDGDDDDGDGGGGDDQPKSKTQRERDRKKTEKGFYQKLMDRKESSKNKMQGGLFDDFIGNMTSEQIFKNMASAMDDINPEEIKGDNAFSNLLMKGLNMKSRSKKRKTRMSEQPPGVLPNGEYRDLNAEERSLLMSEMIQVRLKKWYLKAKTKVFNKTKKKFEKDKKVLKFDIKLNTKKAVTNLFAGTVMKIEKRKLNRTGTVNPKDPKSMLSPISSKVEDSRNDLEKNRVNKGKSLLGRIALSLEQKGLSKELEQIEENIKAEPDEERGVEFKKNLPNDYYMETEPEALISNNEVLESIPVSEGQDSEDAVGSSLEKFKNRVIQKKSLLFSGRSIKNSRIKHEVSRSPQLIAKARESIEESIARHKDLSAFKSRNSDSLSKLAEDPKKGVGASLMVSQERKNLQKDSEAGGGGPGITSKHHTKSDLQHQKSNQIDQIDDQPSEKRFLFSSILDLEPKSTNIHSKNGSYRSSQKVHSKTILPGKDGDRSPIRKHKTDQGAKFEQNGEENILSDEGETRHIIPIGHLKSSINNVMSGIVGFGRAGISKIMGGSQTEKKRNSKFGLKRKQEVSLVEKKVKENNKKLEQLKLRNQMLYNNEAVLRLSSHFRDFIMFWLPNWVSGVYPKKELFYQGREMIRSKLEVGSIVTGMNELEKLKSLLFDENQYYLFQNIQKPFLIGFDVMDNEDEEKDPEEEDDEQQSCTSEEQEVKIVSGQHELEFGSQESPTKLKSKSSSFKMSIKTKRKNKPKSDKKKLKKKKNKKKKENLRVLLSNQSFWNKDDNVQQNVKNFEKALDCINKKGNDKNVIDKRLLNYFNGVFG